jgi:hypothetical protein
MEESSKILEFDSEFSYNTDYKKQYEDLIWRYKMGYERSPFKGRTFADIFLCSIALGFQYKKYVPFPGKKSSGGIPASALKDKGRVLVMVIAIEREKSLDVLFDSSKVYSIAENYANGGFPYLLNIIDQKNNIGSPIVRMENLLREEINNIISRRSQMGENIPEEVEMSPHEKIEHLENTLRLLISRKLGELSENWLRERLPQGILEQWKQREKEKTESQGPKPHKMPIIHYSHLGDLKAIILRKDNWREKFKSIFYDEKFFETQLNLLIPIRNDVMHGNSEYLTPLQLTTLDPSYGLLMDRIMAEPQDEIIKSKAT